MKCFHTTKYTIYKPIIQKSVCILLFSDLHFSAYVSDKKLHLIIHEIQRVKPDYIFIVGDLIDSVDDIRDISDRTRLFQFLKTISKLTKVLISLGNHDCMTRLNKKWEYCYDKHFFDELGFLDNVYLLDNTCYEDEHIFVTGITNSFAYYETGSTFIHPILENKAQIIKELNLLDKHLKVNLPNKLKFALVHSPVYMDDLDVLDILNEYDYILSGHMHNGCVPPILHELWNSDKGIITPSMSLFSKNERNTLKKVGDKLIVNGALTTFQKCSGFMHHMNFIFPMFDTVLSFHSGSEKLLIQKNYHK